MTAKQKAAREKFKKVVAEAGKLRKKNPKLTQAQAVKQAWAISYSKAGETKKVAVAKKKSTPKKKSSINGVKKVQKDWTYATDQDVINNFVPYLEEYVKDGKKYWNSYGLEKRNGKWIETFNYRFNNLKSAKENILAEYGKLPEVRKTKSIGAMRNKTALKKKAAPKKKSAPKKVASKRITDIHKDTKSHNVNIRVVSGINDDILKELKSIQQREIYFTDLLQKQLFQEAALKSQSKGKSAGIAKAQLIATRRYIKDLKNILMRLKKQKIALKKDIK